MLHLVGFFTVRIVNWLHCSFVYIINSILTCSLKNRIFQCLIYKRKHLVCKFDSTKMPYKTYEPRRTAIYIFPGISLFKFWIFPLTFFYPSDSCLFITTTEPSTRVLTRALCYKTRSFSRRCQWQPQADTRHEYWTLSNCLCKSLLQLRPAR
jgi:hypothetical protein